MAHVLKLKLKLWKRFVYKETIWVNSKCCTDNEKLKDMINHKSHIIGIQF